MKRGEHGIRSIRIDKSPKTRTIVSTSQIIQSRLLIVDIPTITERIEFAEGGGFAASGSDRLAPCIVLIFYKNVVSSVKNCNDITLQVVDVGVHGAIEVYHRRTAVRIVVEVQIITALSEIIIFNSEISKSRLATAYSRFLPCGPTMSR